MKSSSLSRQHSTHHNNSNNDDNDNDDSTKKKQDIKDKIVTCQECFYSYHIGCVSPQNPCLLSAFNSNCNDNQKFKVAALGGKKATTTSFQMKDDFYCDDCQPRHILGTTW